jgi:hypothetical protein
MENYKLTDGKEYDEAYFEKLSKKAEMGEYPGTPGEWIVRPKGRPAYCNEKLVTIAFKVPISQRNAIDNQASKNHLTRSQFLRSAVETALQ